MKLSFTAIHTSQHASVLDIISNHVCRLLEVRNYWLLLLSNNSTVKATRKVLIITEDSE